MGLSSHASPSDGLLILLVANTALSVSLLKDLIHSFLGLFLSLRLFSPPDAIAATGFSAEASLRDRFFRRFKPVRSGPVQSRTDCCVCLCRFEPESLVSLLSCGHLLHKGCLETWLDYQHTTCPLCRSHLLPDEGN